MRTLLVLGGGTAGTMIANRLRHRLDAARVAHHRRRPGRRAPLPARLPLHPVRRRYTADQVVRSRHHFLADGIELVLGRDRPGRRRGAGPSRSSTAASWPTTTWSSPPVRRRGPTRRPACSAREWRRSIFDFYTLEGAEALATALASFDHGRLVVHVTEMPIKCPVAPLEFTFLAEAWLRERGLRDRVELVFVTPLDGAFTKPVAAERLGAMLDERKIHVEPDFMVEHIDQERRVLVSYDEREVPFDLLVTVPLNMGADYVARSGLGDELNYVPVDKHTLLSTAYDTIFVARRRQRHPDLEGRLGGPLRGRRLRRQLPRARRRAGR